MRIKDIFGTASVILCGPQPTTDFLELNVPVKLSFPVTLQDVMAIRQAIGQRLAVKPIELTLSSGMQFSITFNLE